MKPEHLTKPAAITLLEMGCIVYTGLYFFRKVKPKKMWSEISLQKRAAIIARWIEYPDTSEKSLKLRTEYLQKQFAIVFGDKYDGDPNVELDEPFEVEP